MFIWGGGDEFKKRNHCALVYKPPSKKYKDIEKCKNNYKTERNEVLAILKINQNNTGG